MPKKRTQWQKDFIKGFTKEYPQDELGDDNQPSPDKPKRELTPYEKMERERKMKEQGLDPQTGQKLKDGGIVCRTKAYKEIIKNPRKK